MSEVSNLNYTSSTGRNVKTNYMLNTYPEGSKYYHKEYVTKDQDGKHVYHTAEQEYSVSYDEGGNAVKLDSLLDDLKNERNLQTANAISITESRPLLTHTSPLHNNNTNVYKKTYHEKVSSSYNNNTLPERNAYHESISSNYNANTLPERNIYHEKVSSTYNTNTVPERTVCVDCTETNKFHDDVVVQEKYYSGKNLESHNTSTKKIISSGLPQDIKEIALVDDILPIPGTKVTTTVRTYTYEIPNNVAVTSVPFDQIDGTIIGDKKLHHLIETTNVQNKYYSQNNSNVPNNGPPIVTGTTNIQNKYYSQNNTNTPNTGPPIERTNIHNIYYTQNTTNTPNNNGPPIGIINNGPPNGINNGPPIGFNNNGQPTIMPNDMDTDRTYYYKNITTNTRNVVRDHTTDDNFTKTKYELDKTIIHHDNDRYPPNSNVPLPSPFPVDETDKLNRNNNPPKRLDDLMATFDNGKPNQNYNESYESKVELDTATAIPGQPPVEARALSKNVQGPPVFYPPGQEMVSRKEEMSGGYRAKGGSAYAASGYEYGAESSSKSKSKSGAAVVPVCLPLCCAMPCTIM